MNSQPLDEDTKITIITTAPQGPSKMLYLYSPYPPPVPTFYSNCYIWHLAKLHLMAVLDVQYRMESTLYTVPTRLTLCIHRWVPIMRWGFIKMAAILTMTTVSLLVLVILWATPSPSLHSTTPPCPQWLNPHHVVDSRSQWICPLCPGNSHWSG